MNKLEYAKITMLRALNQAATELVEKLPAIDTPIELGNYRLSNVLYLRANGNHESVKTLWKPSTRILQGKRPLATFIWPEYTRVNVLNQPECFNFVGDTLYFYPSLEEAEEFISDVEDWLPAEISIWLERNAEKTDTDLEMEAARKSRYEDVTARLKKLT